MKLYQKVVLVLVAACLVFSGVALVQGRFDSAATGVFVSACALITNFRIWPTKLFWLHRKG
jgi:hypothetical protein